MLFLHLYAFTVQFKIFQFVKFNSYIFYLLDEALRTMDALKKVDVNMVPLKGNLVDYIWHDRPKEHFGKVNLDICSYETSKYASKTHDLFFFVQ